MNRDIWTKRLPKSVSIIKHDMGLKEWQSRPSMWRSKDIGSTFVLCIINKKLQIKENESGYERFTQIQQNGTSSDKKRWRSS